MNYLAKAAEKDQRIELIVDDIETSGRLKLFASCDVCLGPSRWEGLGLFLYEAAASGCRRSPRQPPPMNEVIHNGVNGILIGDTQDGTADSGIQSMKPDVGGDDSSDRAARATPDSAAQLAERRAQRRARS